MNRAFKRVFNTVTVFLLSIIFFQSVYAQKLIIRVDQNGFPATYLQDGSWQGMDIDFISELMSRASEQYEFVDIPFPRALTKIELGMIHMIPNLVKNSARSEYMHWLGPNRVTCIGLVVQQSTLGQTIESTDELIRVAQEKKQKIGYLTDASYSPYMDERLKNDPVLKDLLYFLPDNVQHRELLKSGEILGYFHDAFEIQYRLKDPLFATDYEGLAVHDYRIEDSCIGAYLGVSKKLDYSVYQSLFSAFEKMKEDGSFAEIHRKWVGKDPYF